jgi:hypothetical protein
VLKDKPCLTSSYTEVLSAASSKFFFFTHRTLSEKRSTRKFHTEECCFILLGLKMTNNISVFSLRNLKC